MSEGVYNKIISREPDESVPADPEDAEKHPDALTSEPIARPPKRARRRRT